MSNSVNRPTTDSRSLNAILMINNALENTDPVRRARFLADAQRQIAFALSSCLDECEETEGATWAAVAEAVGVGRETLFRQHKARAPIVVIKPTHAPKQEEEMIDSVYTFETENGAWFGPSDALDPGDYRTGVLAFYPNPVAGENKLAGQMLRVKIGPQSSGMVSAHAAMIHLPDGSAERVRVTDEVLALLFSDGQTPLRRAMRAAYYAVVNNPSVDPALQAAVDAAATAMSPTRYTEPEFVAAIRAALDTAEQYPTKDTTARIAIGRLSHTFRDYQSWTQSQSN